MTRFHFERPDGNQPNAQNISIHLNEFVPPQGRRGPPAAVGDSILTLFPPIGDATFQFYKFYQIKPGQVPTTQTNMPVVIIDTLGAGILQQASGFDIRVFDSAGGILEYEVQSVNTVTGEIIVWVNMPTVQDSEFIQLVFGKPTATDGSNSALVYDSNYSSVYHLNGVGTDSTSNAENFTLNGVTTVAAKIGDGLDFTGVVADFTIANPYNSFPSVELTSEIWLKTATVEDTDGIISYAIGNTGPLSNHFLIFNQDSLQLFVNALQAATGIPINDNFFHHMVVTWRSSNGEILLYVDGALVFSSTLATGISLTNGGGLVLGQDQDIVGGGFDPAQAYEGILDEFSLSDIVRSADYIKTRFNNQNDNDAFWFETPLLEDGVDNFLVDHLNNNIVAVQS